MPTLQQITYRKANLTTPSPRTGNKPYPSTPLDPDAQHTYTQTEQTLQALAGSIGLRSIGWDRDERPRTLRDWAWLCPRLIGHTDALIRTEGVADMLDRLTVACERVRAMVTRPSERRLVGVCTECLKRRETVTDPGTGESEEQPVRTPIYATPADMYAVCPECGAFLTLSDTRHHRHTRHRQGHPQLEDPRQNALHPPRRRPLLGIQPHRTSRLRRRTTTR